MTAGYGEVLEGRRWLAVIGFYQVMQRLRNGLGLKPNTIKSIGENLPKSDLREFNIF